MTLPGRRQLVLLKTGSEEPGCWFCPTPAVCAPSVWWPLQTPCVNPWSEIGVWVVLVAKSGLPSSASRSALRAACGDGGSRRRCLLVRSGIGDPQRMSGGSGGQSLACGVLVWVVGGVVVPESPDHLAPGAAEDPDCVLVGGAAGSGAGVDVGCPGVVVAAGVCEDVERAA